MTRRITKIMKFFPNTASCLIPFASWLRDESLDAATNSAAKRPAARHVATIGTMLAAAFLSLPGAGADAEPKRIVSLVPATTEILFAIGAGDRLAGVSNYDRFPKAV
jgi:ABC-type hemin transport system substrate-binding protein